MPFLWEGDLHVGSPSSISFIVEMLIWCCEIPYFGHNGLFNLLCASIGSTGCA